MQPKTKRSVTVYPGLIISYFINLVKSVWSKSKMVSFNKLSEEKGFIEIGPILLWQFSICWFYFMLNVYCFLQRLWKGREVGMHCKHAEPSGWNQNYLWHIVRNDTFCKRAPNPSIERYQPSIYHLDWIILTYRLNSQSVLLEYPCKQKNQ